MHTYTTQKQVREAFWSMFPEASKKKINHYSGKGKMYCTDTRCLFVDFVDNLHRDGLISSKLADNVTL